MNKKRRRLSAALRARERKWWIRTLEWESYYASKWEIEDDEVKADDDEVKEDGPPMDDLTLIRFVRQLSPGISQESKPRRYWRRRILRHFKRFGIVSLYLPKPSINLFSLRRDWRRRFLRQSKRYGKAILTPNPSIIRTPRSVWRRRLLRQVKRYGEVSLPKYVTPRPLIMNLD
jgi:hypothetical protein